MAALNTLRTKGSILLTAVIGISLLAFLLGDGTSLFQKTTVAVGTINGKEVSIKDYATNVEQMTNIRQYMTGASSLSAEETDMVQSQVWNKFISDAVLLPTYKKLGLNISDAELLDMVNGENVSPVIMQVFADPQTGGFDKERVTQFVTNLDMDGTGRARAFWAFMEQQATDNRMNEKYNALIEKGLYITSLQVDQALEDYSNDYSIEYVTKAISSISDEDIKVTDADLKNYYNKHIARFEYSDASDIDYVTFDITPSENDYADARTNVAKLAEEFAASDNIEQFVNYSSEQKFNPAYYKQNELPEYLLGEALENGKTFEPNYNNGVYTIARVNDVKVMPDSITVKSLSIDNTINADSIINEIKAGNFNAVAATYGASTEEVKLSTGGLAPQYVEKFATAKKGEVITFDMNGGKQIISVVAVDQPVTKYQIGELITTVTPSSKTEQDIYNKANAFRNEILAGASFDEAVTKNQYIKRTAKVESANRNFANIENSRELVRWGYKEKTGTVSHIVTIGNMNIVAIVKNKMTKGTAPFEAVKEDVRPLYIAKAKMDKLVKELSGATSLEELSNKVAGTIGSASDIKFSSVNIPGIGNAPEVVGALTSLKEGAISNAIPAGTNAAVVKITAKTPVEGMDAAKIKVMLEAINSNQNLIAYMIGNAIADMIDVKDERVIYY